MTYAMKPGRRETLRGILYMCLATIVLFPALNAAVKYLGSEYSIWQVIWVRSLAHFGVMIALCVPGYGLVKVFTTTRPVLQLLRSACQVGAMFSFLYALTKIPLATVTVIIFLAPVFVVALSIPLLGERVGPRRWIAVIVGLVGALIIIRPGLGVAHWATFLVLGSVTFYAFYQILTRKLAAHDDARTTAVYTVVLPLIASTCIAPFDLAMPGEIVDWLLFLGLGVFGGFSHYFLIKAYETGEASVISPFDYGQLIGATILGYLIWNEFPDVWTWVGAGVIVVSGLYLVHREGRRRST